MVRRRSKPKKLIKRGTDALNFEQYMMAASAGPLNAPRWGFTSSKNGKADTCVFYAVFAAKIYLDQMIADDEVSWDGDAIITSSDVLIEANPGCDLEDIYSHRLTYDEKRYFPLNDDWLKRVKSIRSDSFARPFVAGETVKNKLRTSRKGMVKMKEIAEDLDMDPKTARGILRELMDKPDHGWAWRTAEEVNHIKNLLLGTLPNKVRVDFGSAQ